MKRFIVTGWPCSGTAYTAALFSTLGVRCGHEKVFGIAFLSDGRREKPFPTIIGRHAPEVYESDREAVRAAQALDRVPRDVNSRNRNKNIPWARIAPIAGDLAAHHGYETPVADRAG